MQKFYDCGIDLGTTNSCIAIPDENSKYVIIENQTDRMSVTPSAVLINGKGRMIIGQRAYNSQNVDDLAIQFKRQMGTSKKILFASANQEKTPEELSSEILKRLRADAEQRMNRNIENVVITVPAAFKTLQSEATNKAGKLAGFKNIILLQEPIAAAVAYGVTPDAKDKCWMVFDYGGGTLDVAIVSTRDNQLEVINSEGDNYFGGSDIDRLIFNRIIKPRLIKEGYAIDNIFDEKTSSGKSLVRRILLDCETCKIDLSNRETVTIEIFDIDDDHGNPIEFECDIHRSEFERLIQETVDKSIEIAKKALSGSGLSAQQLDKILLVGGSTFIPLVRNSLSKAFGIPLDSSINPMTVVAAGASIYASTSVVDVEEEIAIGNNQNCIINLTYDPISSEQKVDVVGKIVNIDSVHVSRIRVDCSDSADFSGASWTSGWVDLLDKESGIFDVEVFLQKEKTNTFKVFACDEYGKDIAIENPLFEIRHNENVLRNSAPPATMSIGVKIQDPKTGFDIMDVVIKKNTPLPASADRTYKTTKDIKPYSNDSIRIEILEGENIVNPGANSPAGTIYIQSSQMDRLIPKGTEIEITIEADENRNINVNGYIPDFDYIIPAETLRPESKIDLDERLDVVEQAIEQTEVSINRLKENGMNVSGMETRLKKVKSDLKQARNAVDSDEAYVNGYLDEFYSFQTDVIAEERSHTKSKKKDNNSQYEQFKKDVTDWGDDEDKQKFEELEDSFKYASSEEEKAFVLEKMSHAAFLAKTNNFNWLHGFFDVVLTKSETQYTNAQKAEYWKKQAYEAINDHSVSQLRKSVFELLGLLTSSANEAVVAFGSDLTM